MRQAANWFHTQWRRIRARPRLAVSVVIGGCVFTLTPGPIQPIVRALIAWDVGAGLYLGLAWFLIVRTSVEQMRWRAGIQDDGAVAVLFLTVAAAVASLVAIIAGLAGLKTLPPLHQVIRLGLAAGTFLSSWLLVHTTFALHYAHDYYRSLRPDADPVLQFPGQEPPLYLDFAYFALVVGMTSQTADVAVTTTRMRRLVVAQGLIAFVFNTTLLALTINIAAGLLG